MIALVVALLVGRPAAPPPPLPCHRASTVIEIITCAAERYDVPGGSQMALEVAVCESSLDPRAFNGTHVGLFQHAVHLWPARWRKYAAPLGLPKNPRDPLTNSIVTMRMATDSDIGWSPWSCAR